MAKLDDAQADLLVLLCEAARRQRKKQSFVGTRTFGGPLIRHPQLDDGSLTDFHWPDLDVLCSYGLLHSQQHEKSSIVFDVGPAGFEHFDKLMGAKGRPTNRLEDATHRLLDSTHFNSTFPDAMNSWRGAEALYWADRTGGNASEIGHHCREALQLFGVSFAKACGQSPGPPNKTVANVRAGLDSLRGSLPASRLALLDALLVYWGTVIDVAQRQEHGALKEGDSLGQEDSRIAVFYTALVMFELASALNYAGKPNG